MDGDTGHIKMARVVCLTRRNNDRNLKFSLFSLVIKNNLTLQKLLIFTLEKQLL